MTLMAPPISHIKLFKFLMCCNSEQKLIFKLAFVGPYTVVYIISKPEALFLIITIIKKINILLSMILKSTSFKLSEILAKHPMDYNINHLVILAE
jgi:hypothetical protein